MPPQDK
jgi:hypothetical protein